MYCYSQVQKHEACRVGFDTLQDPERSPKLTHLCRRRDTTATTSNRAVQSCFTISCGIRRNIRTTSSTSTWPTNA